MSQVGRTARTNVSSMRPKSSKHSLFYPSNFIDHLHQFIIYLVLIINHYKLIMYEPKYDKNNRCYVMVLRHKRCIYDTARLRQRLQCKFDLVCMYKSSGCTCKCRCSLFVHTYISKNDFLFLLSNLIYLLF